MSRIEFKINDSKGQHASAIVRLEDIIDIVLRGAHCIIATSKYEYLTTLEEYKRIRKALIDTGNIFSAWEPSNQESPPPIMPDLSSFDMESIKKDIKDKM